ncbi:recombinase family protein [Ancylobacter terrae]|uniref:recombinase family protein n=1 Tax=Ancylobacter sp. sgz301288 TaxID=3342077 RepID=UPI00385C73E0
MTPREPDAAESGDLALLNTLGCEKLFVDEEGDPARPALKAVFDFLRPGDTLAIGELGRVGEDVEAVILAVSRLRDAGISLHVGKGPIIGGTAYGDHFMQSCTELARLIEMHEVPLPERDFRPRRGRPSALSPKDVARARRLIDRGRVPIVDVARILGVSTATVYRYFPRSTPSED